MPAKGRNSRKAIVDAARALFYHQGFAASSYADISERTGLGKGNIHYYFNSKHDLLDEVVEQRLGDIRALLEEWTLECSRPYDCLERFIGMIEDNANDLAAYGCPIGTLNDELGKNQQDLQAVARKMFDLFLAWLEARFRAILPPEQARQHAEFLLIMAQGASVLAHTYHDPGLIAKHARTMRQWLAAACSTEGPV